LYPLHFNLCRVLRASQGQWIVNQANFEGWRFEWQENIKEIGGAVTVKPVWVIPHIPAPYPPCPPCPACPYPCLCPCPLSSPAPPPAPYSPPAAAPPCPLPCPLAPAAAPCPLPPAPCPLPLAPCTLPPLITFSLAHVPRPKSPRYPSGIPF
jgi:hypothetical protein